MEILYLIFTGSIHSRIRCKPLLPCMFISIMSFVIIFIGIIFFIRHVMSVSSMQEVGKYWLPCLTGLTSHAVGGNS